MVHWLDSVGYGAAALLLLAGLGFFVLKGILSTRQQLSWAVILGSSFAVLFFTDSRIHPAPLTLTVLAAMTLAGILAVNGKLPGDAALQKYRTRGAWTGIVTVSLYGSLASFFQRFFLENNERIPFSVTGILYCFAGMIWFIGIVWLGLFLLEAGKNWIHTHRCKAPMARSRAFLVIFLVLCLCQAVVLWAHWPGIVTLDTTYQLQQIAAGFYDDWHNVMYTLLIQAVLAVVPDIGAVAAVQMFLFSLLLTAILMLAYDQGVPVWALCVAGCVFQLCPTQAVSLHNILKDIPFAMAMLWAAYLLALLALEKPWTKKWSYWLTVAADMLLIAGVRHNGIFPMGAMICLFLYLTVRRFSMVRLRALAASVLALAAFALYKGPLFSALDVIPNDQPAYTPLLCAAGGYLNKGLELSEEAEEILERVMPLEDWGDYYDRYVGHDLYQWERPAGSVPYEPGNITMGEAFRVYFEVLFTAPDVAVHDRLSGTDILWNVSMADQGFNIRSFDFVYVVEETSPYIHTDHLRSAGGGVYFQESLPARAYRAFLSLTPENSMVDMLLWRSGAWLIILGILLVFWRCNGMGKMLWVMLPLAANVLACLLSLFHQSFRYVYFVPLLTAFLIYLTVTQGRGLSENAEPQ